MRDFKGMKRQRGRNRGGNSGGGGKPQNANRAFESQGPENMRVRGAAQHVYERYQQLARDAASGSDRVLAENFLQHAEHYYRVVRTLQPTRPPVDFASRDPFSPQMDIDVDEYGEPQAEAPDGDNGNGEARAEGDLNGQSRRDRFDRNGSDREREFRGDRNDRFERDRPRQEFRDRPDRPENREPSQHGRDDRPEGRREEGEGRQRDNRWERKRERGRYGVPDDDAPRTDPLPVIEPTAVAEAPREERGPRLRSQDGESFEAPAFLSAATPAPSAAGLEDETPAPRKRAPRKRKTDDAAAAPPNEDS